MATGQGREKRVAGGAVKGGAVNDAFKKFNNRFSITIIIIIISIDVFIFYFFFNRGTKKTFKKKAIWRKERERDRKS